ncbi:MAG TPA: NfeD family protein [Cyclobacteriaceae bacterium]|jgi:membrane-bound ClpP family serine protease
MEWVAIISLIIVGIALIVVEIIFVPGTTVVGILGFGMVVGGVVMAFNNFGIRTGYAVAAATAVANGAALFWSLRTKPWRKLSLQSAIDSRVNEGVLADVKVGDEGVAVSALRPAGKAEIGGKMYEVTTLGNFAPAGTPVKVIRISSNQVVVEPKSN